ncbi:RNA-dependent RNA polymerase [Geosmithia morbida]|uniref:RNA-dependent RNA polymerase n=1 Tax=Geosmithia morbida TaxID=1094350 RepID=A0A9P5D4P0_9HYPO|nr:RNA-dependent RNA polymerase [Geosmithia morbida]KAF4121684.1 RNA-dependent RNA polymerase [Geosmithia morbida]
MEVILKGLPPSFSNEDLGRELDPFMKALFIRQWSSDKPQRKPHAWVYFDDPADGKKFIGKHGKLTDVSQGKSRRPDIARMHITKVPVFIERSSRAPRQFIKLKPTAKNEQPNRGQAPKRNPANLSSGSQFLVQAIDCGHNFFHHETKTLTFARQTGFRVPGSDSSMLCELTQQSMTINREDWCRIEIQCHTIHDFIANENDCTLTLVLAEPPRFYEALSHSVMKNQLRTKWQRCSSCPKWNGHSSYVGRCLVYRLWLLEPHFRSALHTITAKDLISVTNDNLAVDMTPEPFIHDYASGMSRFETRINQIKPVKERLPFILLFQVQALVWNNYIHPATGFRMLERMEDEARAANENRTPFPYTMEAMKKLYQEIPYACPGRDPAEVDADELLNRVADITRDMRQDDSLLRMKYEGDLIPDHQAWVMKAMVTPTRVILHGPDAESKNRILRKFSNHTDYFIRCLFCDDDGQDLSFNPNVSNDAIFSRYRGVLQDGLQIAGRHFSFLGFSHSSLRSHSVWLMAPFVDSRFQRQDYQTIIKSLGTFSNIRVPAKCAARIGQAFSETPYAVPIFETNIQNRSIPDVKNADGSRIFSDGVGTISLEAAREFWARLPKSARAATCFQIRWAGSKGMLSLDTRLRGKLICIRNESMRKFPSDDAGDLGICDTASKPLHLMLNRQMIKILEDMGTPDQWFVDMQNRELRIIRAVTATASNTSTFLRYQLIGSSMAFPQFIKRLDRIGADYRTDTFLKTVVEHVVLRELRLLKHKARIPVEKGITLFGIMDETGFLREHEVYVTFDKTTARIGKLPSYGRAIITRSPALHPGDIRLVNLVTPPVGSPLRDLRNCVVFSQHGNRDLPSQLSGGDLDGDLYNIIWDQEAMPRQVFAPADYPRVDPKPLDRDVTRDDIADFFINFMKTDILGVIATRHQIMADIKDEGTADPDCLALAEMHSTAVDSSKTGIPVEARALPKPPRTRPDFLAPVPPLQTYDIGQISHIGDDWEDDNGRTKGMGMYKHRFHKSTKILGKLYRSVDEKRIWRENISAAALASSPSDKSVWDKVLAHTHMQISLNGYNIEYRDMEEQAIRIRNLYEYALHDLMWQFSDNPRVPITEVEVFCGCILNKRGSQTRRQRDSSIKLQEEADKTMEWVVRMMCDRDKMTTQESVVALCLACVYASGAQGTATGGNAVHGTDKLQSFKAVAASCLLKELYVLEKMTMDHLDPLLMAMGAMTMGTN